MSRLLSYIEGLIGPSSSSTTPSSSSKASKSSENKDSRKSDKSSKSPVKKLRWDQDSPFKAPRLKMRGMDQVSRSKRDKPQENYSKFYEDGETIDHNDDDETIDHNDDELKKKIENVHSMKPSVNLKKINILALGIKVGETEEEASGCGKCPVCWCSLVGMRRAGGSVWMMDCGHLICGTCKEGVFKSNNKVCPYCREPLLADLKPVFL